MSILQSWEGERDVTSLPQLFLLPPPLPLGFHLSTFIAWVRELQAMAKKSGKKPLSFFSARSSSRLPRRPPPIPKIKSRTSGGGDPTNRASNVNRDVRLATEDAPPALAGTKGGKKKVGSRLWMRIDRVGNTEVVECDRNAIIRRAGVPARDLRILGPFFAPSSSILAREKAMVVNLEFIKAIVTAEEVLLLDPMCQEVIPFIEQLRQQLSPKNPVGILENAETREKKIDSTGEERELPFEFQTLEVALEVVCAHLDSSVADLTSYAYPVMDELTKHVSTKNLELVRSLKSNITRLLGRVSKVRDEIEHLLDDNEDMAQLYLTRKQIMSHQIEASMAIGVSNSILTSVPNFPSFLSSLRRNSSFRASIYPDEYDIEDLEMLLEAYFVQLDGTHNRILSVREYIDDTEDYINIQLDNQRNELIQLQMTLSMFMFGITIDMLIIGAFGMNIPCQLYEVPHIFTSFTVGTSLGCFVIFLLMVWYARWEKLLGS